MIGGASGKIGGDLGDNSRDPILEKKRKAIVIPF
tara:strand:- start:1742 stop:1843 length:102 start_codon:yes stop_codon:yes gene_type:complete